MATGYFSVWHDSGATVSLRIMRLSDEYIFDFDDSSFKASLAACTDPYEDFTERSDVGDSDESLYNATLDLSDLNSSDTPAPFLTQAVLSSPSLSIIANAEIWVAGGGIVGEVDISGLLQITGSISSTGVTGAISISSVTVP